MGAKALPATYRRLKARKLGDDVAFPVTLTDDAVTLVRYADTLGACLQVRHAACAIHPPPPPCLPVSGCLQCMPLVSARVCPCACVCSPLVCLPVYAPVSVCSSCFVQCMERRRSVCGPLCVPLCL
jgi:hypothetical protein